MSTHSLPGHALTDRNVSLLVDIFPQATRLVAGVLADMEEHVLAAGLLRQQFHGRCKCRPGCRFILTAPPGSSGSHMLWLEMAGDMVGEVSLDPSCQFVTNLDISDCETAGIPLNWLDATVPQPRSI